MVSSTLDASIAIRRASLTGACSGVGRAATSHRAFSAARSRLWWIALIALVLIVDFARPTGWLGSDDAAYRAAAEHLLTGTTIERAHHHYARLAMILPVAVSMWLFGDTPSAVALPSVLAGVGCVVLVARIGALTWNVWTGLCAATFLAVIPYFRVLSTTAFPDVHACFWSAAAVWLAMRSHQSESDPRRRPALLALVLAGVTSAIALSAKITCAAVLPIVFAITCLERPIRLRYAVRRAMGVTCGVLLGFVFEGCFYWIAAGDFWFSLHSLRNTQGAAELFAGSELRRATDLLSFVMDRLALPLRPAESGWGLLGAAFWPVMIGSLVLGSRARILAAWGLLAYLSVAFMPVSSADGFQPMPIFHGRHVLTATIPFALCLGNVIHGVAAAIARRRIRAPDALLARAWPAVIVAAMCLFATSRRDLNGFQDRDTRRVGLGIRALLRDPGLPDTGDIVMTASMYWRFGILFPAEHRPRLRVAVPANAPDWWRTTVPGIEARTYTAKADDRATLLATPRQLLGEPEPWDYACPLPRDAQGRPLGGDTLATVVRGDGGRVRTVPGAVSTPEDAVLLAVRLRNVP